MTLDDLYQFKRCSLQYKLTKIDRVTEELNSNDGLRASIQSTINYFYYNLQDGKFLGMEDLKEKFAEIWYGDLDLYDIKTSGNQEKRKKELEAIGMIQMLHRNQKYNPDKVFAVNLDFKVPFTGNITIKDRIPLVREVDEGYEIVIFKTSQSSIFDEFWQKTDMGISLISMAFESIFKQQPARICIESLRTGKKTYVTRDRKDYRRLYRSVKMMDKAIEEEWFYPNESFMCRSCVVKNICMEWN